jgi:anthranilate synthase component II
VPAPRILVVDNFDSFTFMLVDYLLTEGAEVTVRRNREIAVEEALSSSDAVLISPGPGRPEDAGISVALAAACIERAHPLLGVCLGHQAIAAACGLRVERVAPVHGNVHRVRHDGSGLLAGLPARFAATRYHSLAVPEVGQPLIGNAWCEEDAVLMGLRHCRAPVHGVQFHPESIGTDAGRALLHAFVRLAAAPPAAA